jgi:hypothetical protein
MLVQRPQHHRSDLPPTRLIAPYNSDHTHLQEYLADAREKGPKHAQEAGIHWTVNKKPDPMTDMFDTKVESLQASDEAGVEGRVIGRCLSQGHAQFTAIVTDRSGFATI